MQLNAVGRVLAIVGNIGASGQADEFAAKGCHTDESRDGALLAKPPHGKKD